MTIRTAGLKLGGNGNINEGKGTKTPMKSDMICIDKASSASTRVVFRGVILPLPYLTTYPLVT